MHDPITKLPTIKAALFKSMGGMGREWRGY